MKTKHFFMTFAFLLAGLTMAYAADKPVTTEQLPKKARNFLSKHFPDSKIQYATLDDDLFDKSYEVYFSNGGKVEFDGKGEWKEIDCPHDKVPDAAIPETILKFVKERHPDNQITEIDRDTDGYDVKLNNGIELKFNRGLKFMRYDD